MLRFKQIEIENFGPYKGRQVLDFPNDGGVVVVYGENGRGKTSLLNAFRYALFGKVRREGHEDVSLHRIPNVESAREGIYEFKVVLRFTYAGSAYELTRAALPLSGMAPQSSKDFKEEVILRKDGTALGPDARDLELIHIMPEEVSRFFLFDGELLREYEELLKRESVLGDKIQEAIERILGVPVLKHARTDLDALHEQAQKHARTVAAQSLEGEQLAAELENLAAERKHLQNEIERMEVELKDLIGEKTDLESYLRQYEQVKARLDRRRRLEEEVEASEGRIATLRSELKEAMSSVWRGMLSDKVRTSHNNIREELEQYRSRAATADFARRIESALEEGSCPTCSQSLSGEAKQRLRRELDRLRLDDNTSNAERAGVLTRREVRLRNFGLEDNREIVKRVSEDLGEAIVRKETLEGELSDLRQQTADFKEREKEIGAKYERYDRVVEEIKALQDGVAANRILLEEKRETARGISQNLEQLGNANINIAQQRADFYGRLHALFSSGVGTYRDRLRTQVEADASALFACLTHEPDYTGLRINDNYGLSIVLQDGTEIPGHSAGEGQVVALSLMGALQKNAPLQGPIIMDSSFTRLDGEHKRNLLRALPEMSPQVMLLVFEEELEPEVIREHVGAQLLAEYEMGRRSATHTELHPRH